MPAAAIDFSGNAAYVHYMFSFSRENMMQLRAIETRPSKPVSPVIQRIEAAADAVGWQPVEPFPWLGRSALVQSGRARLAIIVPRNEVKPELIEEQAARLRAHSVRGLWLVPPALPSETRQCTQAIPAFPLLNGAVAGPGHSTPIDDFIQGALSGRLKWASAPCPSVYGLWVVSTKCPACQARQEYPAGALWLRGAVYDEKRLSCPPPAPLLPLDPEGIDDVRAFSAALARPAALSRDHLGIAAHCAHCGCVLPQVDRANCTGDLHVTAVSSPVIDRGWWTWDGWPRPALMNTAEIKVHRNYDGSTRVIN